MNILSFIANNLMMVVVGLMGILLITAAGWLSHASKTVRQPVRIPWDRRK